MKEKRLKELMEDLIGTPVSDLMSPTIYNAAKETGTKIITLKVNLDNGDADILFDNVHGNIRRVK